MNRKKLLIGLLIPVLLAASAFGLWQLGRGLFHAFIAKQPSPTVPARLVTRIDVGAYPVGSEESRSYTDQKDLTSLLGLLRNIATAEPAPDAPSPESAKSFYTITLTYAGGSSTICYLLEGRYVRLEGDSSYFADPQILEQFHAFFASHPGGES